MFTRKTDSILERFLVSFEGDCWSRTFQVKKSLSIKLTNAFFPFFVSTAFHEVLHKYINAILEKKSSAVLKSLKTDLNSLYGAHLHLFALQKKVFTDLRLTHLLPAIKQLEATHGPEYVRAWKTVHGDALIYQSLLNELKN